MEACPICGTHVLYDVTVLEEATPQYMCAHGHRGQEIVFRPVRPYNPPLRYVRCAPLAPMFHAGPPWPPPVELNTETAWIFCGPAAHLPAVPTPTEILESAGLGYLGDEW